MKVLESEFRRSVMPIAIINSIFCTGLFEYFTDRLIHVIGFVYIICGVISYYKGFTVLINMMYGSWSKQMTNFELIMVHFEFFHNIIIYTLMIFAGIKRRKRVQIFIRQLENCTRAMDELGIPGSYSPMITHKYLVALCFSTILIAIVFCQLCFVRFNNNYGTIIFYCLAVNIPTFASFIVDFSFVYWIRFAKIKLGQLNMALRSMLTTTIDSPQHRRVLRVTDKWNNTFPSSNISPNSKIFKNVRKLERIKHIHLELIKFARNTNEAYGLHILMSMIMCFLLITTILYNLYFNISASRWTLNSINTFIFIYWIFFYGFELFFVNNMCEVTSMETRGIIIKIFIIFPYAAETGNILCELYEPSASKEFRDAVRKFTYQIVQNPLTFTARGFFDLDHTFISCIIGSVTTYLVILIQIGHGTKKESKTSTANSTSTI